MFARLWERWEEHLVKRNIADKGKLSIEELVKIVKNNGLNGLVEGLIRKLLKFDQIDPLKNLLKNLPNVADLFARLSGDGKFDEEIAHGFGRRVKKYYQNQVKIRNWLETVQRVNVLSGEGRWDGAIRGSLRELIEDRSVSCLEWYMNLVPGAREILCGLLGSGELDEDTIGCLNELMTPNKANEGGDLIRVLLKADRVDLVSGWLKRLDKGQYISALGMLSKAAPATNGLLREVLSDKKLYRGVVDMSVDKYSNDGV